MRKPGRKSKITIFLVILLAGILTAGRLYLPTYVRTYVKRTLDQIPGYSSDVGEIDISLWRGAYSMAYLRLNKTSGNVPVPFFSSSTIDLSVQWKALLDGALVGEIELAKPKLNFVSGPSETQSQTDVESTWTDQVRELFPLRINRVGLVDAEIHYRDFYSDPEVDIYLHDIEGEISNLTNSEHLSKSLVATINAKGKAQETGIFSFETGFDPYQKQKTFKSDLSVEKLQIREINSFLKAYGNFDAEEGELNIYSKMSAEKGKINGYVKPIIKDLSILRWNTVEPNPLRLVWEGVLAGFFELFQNQRHAQIATQINFTGDINDPQTSLWEMARYFLKNGFIKALEPGTTVTVNLNDRE